MQHANKSLHFNLGHVFDNIGLMAESDASEEFCDHNSVGVEGSRQDHIGCFIMVLCCEFQFIRQII
jgi:hypothetical protein